MSFVDIILVSEQGCIILDYWIWEDFKFKDILRIIFSGNIVVEVYRIRCVMNWKSKYCKLIKMSWYQNIWLVKIKNMFNDEKLLTMYHIITKPFSSTYKYRFR